MRAIRKKPSVMLALVLAGPVGGQALAQDPKSRAEGLAAFAHVYAVAAHPRCSNCHVGDQGIPMWNGLSYGDEAVHGMYVHADESRIGAQTMLCQTCHATAKSANETAHAAPQIEEAWRLPPPDMAWFGKSQDEVCAKLRDPDTNGGRDAAGLVLHLESSAFVAWGFEPGGERTAPDGTLDDLLAALTLWGSAGMPCAQDR